MATSPSFVKKYKHELSDSGTLEFTPTVASRLYHAYCRNSSGAGNIAVTGNPVVSAGAPKVQPIVITNRLLWFNSGIGKIFLSGTGKYYEVIKHAVYPTLDPINIQITGTFPLTYDTTVNYEFTGEHSGVGTVALAAGDTRLEACDKILTSLLSTLSQALVRFDNNSTQKQLPTLTYIDESGSTPVARQVNLTLKASAAANVEVLLSLVDFTQTATSNGASYAYDPLTVDSIGIDNSIFQSLTAGKPLIHLDNGTIYATEPNLGISGVLAFPHPQGGIGVQGWDTTSTAGSEFDPYLLMPDLKSKLQTLISNGITVDGQTFQGQSAYVTTTEDLPSPPVLATDSFVGAGENKDAFSDTNLPFKLTDVQGNKFFPLSTGQKIKISAPEAESIILVYTEE